jgi:transcriptional regulator with XRE-family HTH domain
MVTDPPTVGPEFWATDQMRDALGSWHMGRVIAAYRQHPHHGRVLRQDIVAGWMGITQAQLSRIENGLPVNDLHKLRRWAAVLGIPADLLWFKLPHTAPAHADSTQRAPRAVGQSLPVSAVGDSYHAEIEDMNRRELLRLIGVAAASLATPLLGVVGADFSGTADAVHADAVEQYAPLNAQLWQMYAAARTKGAMLPLVRSQLDVLTHQLQHAPSAAGREVFAGLLADLLQLSGEVSFDLNNYTDAAHCYTLAAMASKEANNSDLWACALTRQSFISVYERQFGAALPLLEAATRLAEGGDTQLSTRYWVSTVKAHAYAGMGDITSCQRSLDHAEEVHHLTTPPETTGWLRFNGSRLAEERGTCFVELHRHDLAETSLTNALQQDPSERRKGSIYTDLAIVGAQRNDTDCVATWAQEALAAVNHTKSGYVTKKLVILQTHIRPLLDNRSMRDLNEQITHVLQTTTTT